MLLEVARQFVRDKNGRLLLSRAYMATRGWKSMAMLNKCKAELIEAGFPFQTVQGHRPNKASWYAVTWRALDKHPGYDAGAAHLFIRGAYQNGASLTPPPTVQKYCPLYRPMVLSKHVLGVRSVPPQGHHLEKRSTAPQTTH